MFENMFEPADINCAAEVRNFFKFTSASFFFLPHLGMSTDFYISSSDSSD